DEGSGKTEEAAIALYATKTAGKQGAMKVPTENIAQQHMESLQQMFDPLEVRTALLPGSTKTKEPRLILEELANGQI
ncbi:DEAD/DEAH box helicase, partial [Enterococcus faecalis]|uniref:DEAD/DEAH box helicase n=1 Tax=Enterococcus faecalis TaxID=1351 RepID=UPI003D6AF065